MAEGTKDTKKKTAKTSEKVSTKTVKAPKEAEKKDKSKTIKKVSTSTKTDKVKKEKKAELELVDLEGREADLEKTVVIKSLDEADFIITSTPKKESKQKTEKQVKTILGAMLPIGDSSEDRKERLKFYAKDALIFSVIIPVFDLLAMLFLESYTFLMITNSVPLNYVLTLVTDFIIIFAMTFLFDYLIGDIWRRSS